LSKHPDFFRKESLVLKKRNVLREMLPRLSFGDTVNVNRTYRVTAIQPTPKTHAQRSFLKLQRRPEYVDRMWNWLRSWNR